ncbi:uncharacterized protein LOC135697668 [Ochlerotatus camptorhynchus]|uniref:uncharacterized protein LOC135697668 n=1 Tax=Ochlerotatus camptorhynchus TaxID=644619 RepID=UPI0031D9BCCD
MGEPSSTGERKILRKILVEECTASENGFVICAIDRSNSCKYRQTANKLDPGNFIRHIRTEHAELAMARGLFREEMEAIAKKRKISKRLIAIDRQIFVEAMIKLITIHHVPLHCVDWEGFKLLLDPISNSLNVRMNRPNLMRHLLAAADKIRNSIKSLVKGKLLCLKIDSATRYGRHILGVNIQLFDPEKQEIAIYTIGNFNVILILNRICH